LPNSFWYLDGLLVASCTVDRSHLQKVLGSLQQNRLMVNSEKCVFGQLRIEFLGHSVSAAGVSYNLF
jgi:hypothetical protein